MSDSFIVQNFTTLKKYWKAFIPEKCTGAVGLESFGGFCFCCFFFTFLLIYKTYYSHSHQLSCIISAKLCLFKAARLTFTQVSTQSHSGHRNSTIHIDMRHYCTTYGSDKQKKKRKKKFFLYKRQIKVCLCKLPYNDAFIQWFYVSLLLLKRELH